ncbi:MAG: threonine/serine exporter [Clostridiaceae bacterium]|nr:threonine/serine exporter [Clostridiaceae bacterium]
MSRIILSFLGSLCPAVLLNTERKNLIWAGLSGTLGMLINDRILAMFPNTALLAVFFGTATVAVYSELMARVRKTPATIFLIPGIIPLVPGVDAYRTIQLIAERDYPTAMSYAVSAVAKACLIAFGIMTVSAVFRKINRSKKHVSGP